MSDNTEETKKTIEVKMYFSTMETVLKHLCSVNPVPRMEEALRYLNYALSKENDTVTITDAKQHLEQELVAFNETLSNLLMVVDTYLSMNAPETTE